MYNVYSFIYQYDEVGKLLKCKEESLEFEGNFDLSYEKPEKSKMAMEKIGSVVFSSEYLGKTHRRYYAIDDTLELPCDNLYDQWSFIISNSHILLGYSFKNIE